jgi:hypothetical protein
MCNCFKEETEYYTRPNQANGALYKDCKECHNKRRREKSPTGINKLPEDKLERIIEALRAKVLMKSIAITEGINYQTLSRWKCRKSISFTTGTTACSSKRILAPLIWPHSAIFTILLPRDLFFLPSSTALF